MLPCLLGPPLSRCRLVPDLGVPEDQLWEGLLGGGASPASGTSPKCCLGQKWMPPIAHSALPAAQAWAALPSPSRLVVERV